MIGKSVLIIGQMLGLFVGDQFNATNSLTKEQYANYYFQYRGLFVGDKFNATNSLTKEQYTNYYFQFRAY